VDECKPLGGGGGGAAGGGARAHARAEEGQRRARQLGLHQRDQESPQGPGACQRRHANSGQGLTALHSSTFQLNLSALYGIGGARRGCVARINEMLGGV